MGFKLISKNNMGLLVTLIFIILLLKASIYNFFIDSPLGRTILLMVIIFISYNNKFLGLFSVLAVIIAFNQYNSDLVKSYNFYEAFDSSGNSLATSIIQDEININKAQEDLLNKKISALKQKSDSSQTTTTSPTDTSTTETFRGSEGFCMTDRETNILRGKQSNTISVNSQNKYEDVVINPFDNSVFSNLFSSF